MNISRSAGESEAATIPGNEPEQAHSPIYIADQTWARSASNCFTLKPGAKSGLPASGGRIAYASSTHSSHHFHVPRCVLPHVTTVTPFWSYSTAKTACPSLVNGPGVHGWRSLNC